MDTKKPKTKYEVLIAGEWCKCRKAEEQPSGWLHYELFDNTIGLSRPGNWRKQDGMVKP